MSILIGFAAGIAFCSLLDKLQKARSKKFKQGDEDVCTECKFRKTVIDALDEVEKNEEAC